MPKSEIKNTFTGGRMNKDLDERLITTGEYRDAMNVQVTTSSGSDVGSLHNIMGNYKVSNISNSEVAMVMGSVTDEKTNNLYWMIAGLTNNIQVGALWPNEYYKADAIAEYDYDTDTVSPVIVDVYECVIKFAGGFTAGDIFTIASNSELWNGSIMRKRIYPGMILTVILTNGNLMATLEVGSVDYNTGEITFTSSVLDQVAYLSMVNIPGTKYTFTSPQRALNFEFNHLITGINIIDKQLFWTDNNSEPKRIHIERYRGTPPGSGGAINGSWTEHSYTPTRDFTQTQLIYTNTYPLLEEHITVIRQKPIVAPQLLMDNSVATGITEGEIVNATDSSGNSINSIGHYKENDTAWIDFHNPVPDFQVGNILNLTTTDASNITKTMRVWIGDQSGPGGIWHPSATGCDPNGTGPCPPAWYCASGVAGSCTAFKVNILSADPGVLQSDIDWHAELEQEAPLFEFKFPRFATRYKYEDGEYSAFGPFSEVAFLPDRPGGKDFDFVAYKGYNIGMTNQIRRLI